MSRLARRLHLARAGREPIVAPEQRILDTALRGKSLQEVRHHLRRMDSVVVFTPRWSATSQFWKTCPWIWPWETLWSLVGASVYDR